MAASPRSTDQIAGLPSQPARVTPLKILVMPAVTEASGLTAWSAGAAVSITGAPVSAGEASAAGPGPTAGDEPAAPPAAAPALPAVPPPGPGAGAGVAA